MKLDEYKKYEPIDGKWHLVKELGSGAYGTVFEAQRIDYPEMKSAIKIISIPANQSEIDSYRKENYDLDERSVTEYFSSVVDEFVNEFKVMYKLRGNTNIVSYEDHEVIKKTTGIGWDIFIRMELLRPFNSRFAQKAPTERDVIRLGIDICRALEVCEANNIIHRDIKPSNIFVSEAGNYKLGDFGVARTLEKTTNVLSQKGTYLYMAPEVYKGQQYDASVDIYSLGLVMYKLLNNNLDPFCDSRSFKCVEDAKEKRMSGAALKKPKNASEALANIILKACSYNPKDRYAGPALMRMDLERIFEYQSTDQGAISLKNEATSNTSNEVGPELFSDDERTSGIFEKVVTVREAAPQSIDLKNKADLAQQRTDEEESPKKHTDPVNPQIDLGSSTEAEDIGSVTPQMLLGLYKALWQNCFKYTGCIGRKKFWLTILANAIVGLLLIILSYLTTLFSLLTIYQVVLTIPMLSLFTRRLHDTGRSGHWQWLYLTGFGAIAVLVFCCMKSKYRENKYRQTPKES